MRKWLLAVSLVTALLVGYALAPGAARAQTTALPFTPGQRMLLTFEGARNQQWCTVTNSRGDFVGCAAERTAGVVGDSEIWYNLRFIERAERRDR
jgi:hypothetical protein